MSDDIDSKFDDGPPVASAGSLTDERGLYGEFRAFRAEMRTSFELLTFQILPLIKRYGEEIDDLKERVAALEGRPRRRR